MGIGLVFGAVKALFSLSLHAALPISEHSLLYHIDSV